MSQFILLFAPDHLRSDMFGEEVFSIAWKNIDDYKPFPLTFTTDKTGDDAAEEAFDLTNNPGRDADRRVAGFVNHRSLCTGDVVRVIGFDDVTDYICKSFGWEKM